MRRHERKMLDLKREGIDARHETRLSSRTSCHFFNYRLCMRALAVPLPVRHCRCVVCVRVAVVAEVGAGVVLADILGHDAAAGEALAGVFQALHEPIGIERRHIGRAARGDNDRHLGGDKSAVLQLDLLLRPRCHVTAFLILRRDGLTSWCHLRITCQGLHNPLAALRVPNFDKEPAFL